MSETNKLPKRSEINREDQWAIEDLYENDEKWQQEYDEIMKLIHVVSDYQGRLNESANIMLQYLQFSDQLSKLLERVYVYANQRYHEDTANATYQKLSDLASNIMVAANSTTSFAVSEILSIPYERIQNFMKEQPELSVYQRFFELIYRKKEHVLSEKEEKILAEVSELAEAPDTIFSMFNNADLKFGTVTGENGEKVELTHARYSLLLQSKDRRVREEAFMTLYAEYSKYKNMLAATFSANIKQEIFYAKVRKYSSTLAMELSDSNIPVSVYDNLIQAVHEKLPLLHRYVSLRKKVLRLEKLHMYDLYTPMVGNIEMKVPFEEAKRIVKEALAPLGKAYLQILQEGYDKGWIDVYENQGKRSGAYSWGAYGTHPYVLLNYQENLNNVFTLAHEMGHAIHSYYSDLTQPYCYAGYKIFVAEVASTCNEALLIHHLLQSTSDRDKRAYLLNYYLEQFRTTLYRQTMFAEFEKIVHGMQEQGEPLTAQKLCQVYHELNEQYFGVDAVIDEQIDMEWARIPHFYNAFYVYQYATGFSAAIALSNRILQEGEQAVEDYIGFLKGGSSKDPIDLLKGAGVDMTTEQPVLSALSVFEGLLDELENLLV